MKHFIALGVAMSICVVSFSQLSISGGYSVLRPVMQYNLSIDQTYDHHRFGISLNINQGQKSYLPEVPDVWFMKPDLLSEYFGVTLSYNYIFNPTDPVQLYLFTDLGYTVCGISTKAPQTPTANEYPKVGSISLMLGAGYRSYLNDNWFLDFKAGAGLYHQYYLTSPPVSGGTSPGFKFGFGIGYKF